MVNKIMLLLAIFVSILPINALRVFFFRNFFGYNIDYTSHIGMFTVIWCETFRCGHQVIIGKFNRFVGPFSLEIGNGAKIEYKNEFICNAWARQNPKYARECCIGSNTLITSNHFFDLTGYFKLGDMSWIAGRGSQFWTHGAGSSKNSVIIGTDCYLGTAVRFAPGASIGNQVIIGMGSVVTKVFSENCALIAGFPAKLLKENYDWRARE